MKYSEIGKTKLSKMSLGTVQLGMNYGIANNAGQPKRETSYKMLAAALENGITSLDTAYDYGDALEVLGGFFKTYTGKMPFITTKIPDVFENGIDNAEKNACEHVERSLEMLGVDRVNCIMLHNVKNLHENGDKAARAMASLVKHGYTDSVGASVYTGEDLEALLSYDTYTATQIPMSIFDQRLIRSGMVERLHMVGTTVFVRSVFLQGLFFLDPEKITDPILEKQAKERLRLLARIAADEKMTIAALAIAFIRDIPGVASLVLGADTPEQVKSNIAYFETAPLSEKSLGEIHEAFADVDIPEIMKVLSRPKD